MWNYRDCPLCGKELEVKDGDPHDPIYLLRCSTPLSVPSEITDSVDPAFPLVSSSYHRDQLSSHFEVEYQNHKPFHQKARIYPFIIESYEDVTNIYKYDDDLLHHFIVETPYLELPWDNQEKIIKKLLTYTIFS